MEYEETEIEEIEKKNHGRRILWTEDQRKVEEVLTQAHHGEISYQEGMKLLNYDNYKAFCQRLYDWRKRKGLSTPRDNSKVAQHKKFYLDYYEAKITFEELVEAVNKPAPSVRSSYQGFRIRYNLPIFLQSSAIHTALMVFRYQDQGYSISETARKIKKSQQCVGIAFRNRNDMEKKIEKTRREAHRVRVQLGLLEDEEKEEKSVEDSPVEIKKAAQNDDKIEVEHKIEEDQVAQNDDKIEVDPQNSRDSIETVIEPPLRPKNDCTDIEALKSENEQLKADIAALKRAFRILITEV